MIINPPRLDDHSTVLYADQFHSGEIRIGKISSWVEEAHSRLFSFSTQVVKGTGEFSTRRIPLKSKTTIKLTKVHFRLWT